MTGRGAVLAPVVGGYGQSPTPPVRVGATAADWLERTRAVSRVLPDA